MVLNNIYEAVSYLHCNGVIHRDIKPENIVIEHVCFSLPRGPINCAISGGLPTPAEIIGPPSVELPSMSVLKSSRGRSTTRKLIFGVWALSPTNSPLGGFHFP